MRIQFTAEERPTLIARLGLSETATDAEIAAGAATLLAETAPQPDPQPQPGPEPSPSPEPQPEPQPQPGPEPDPNNPNPDPEPEDGDDTVTVDAQAYADLELRARRTEHLEEEARVQRRNDLIEGAIRDGKFAPSRREHYRARYDDDPDGVTARIDRMRDNVVPVEARGVEADPDNQLESDAYPSEWVPEATARQNGGGSPEKPASRIHGEE